MIGVPSLEEIYRTHVDFVWRMLCRSGLPEADARDACQEVFLTIHRALPDFEGRSSMSTWVFTICRSVARDFRNRAHRRHEVLRDELGDEVDPGKVPFAILEERRRLSVLMTILDQLEETQREVFVLHELEGLDGPAIAEWVGVPVATVYSRLRLARQAFQRACSRFQATERFALQRATGDV